MSSKVTDCPVCGKQFSSNIISEHVNACLGRESGPDSDTDNTVKKSSARLNKLTSNANGTAGTNHKQQQGWGFLSGYSKKRSVSQLESCNRLSKKGKFTNTSRRSRENCNSPADNDDNDNMTRPPKHPIGKSPSENIEIILDCEDNLINMDKSSLEFEAENNNILSDSQTQCDIRTDNSNKKKYESKLSNSEQTSKDKAGQKPFGFLLPNKKIKKGYKDKPLAERMRPHCLEDYIGQGKTVGKKSLLYSLLVCGENIPSMILWGPPGCGKTTLAKIIAQKSKEMGTAKFVALSATSASVSDVKEAVKIAKNDIKMFHKKTILFLDEIHRFNKLQQDVLLPHVEDGTLTLIGATTENPSFQVNSALLSRSRVIALDKLEKEDIKCILLRALSDMNVAIADSKADDGEYFKDKVGPHCIIDTEAIDVLSSLVDGDARAALNGLEITLNSKLVAQEDERACCHITAIDVKEGLQKSHIQYDRAGEEHYNTVSALIKSMRGSNDNAALYWLARMLEGGEEPMFIARRLVIFASEDVGLADPQALLQAVATMQACHMIGMPECALNLSQCVVYLSRAPKSVEVYKALTAARACVKSHEGPQPAVPLHLRNASNKFLKTFGYGKDYKYTPAHPGENQEYLPSSLIGTDFFALGSKSLQ